MTIRYHCVECDAAMKIKDEKAGTTGHCPKCKAEFIVPAPDHDESMDATVETKVEGKADRADFNSDATIDATVEATFDKSVEDPDAPQKTPEEIAEDEFQAILMGGDSPKDKRSRETLVVESDPDDAPPKKRRAEVETDSAEFAEPAPPKKRTTAEISKAMMGKNAAEPTMKKTGKAFGEANTENESTKAKNAREARLYYLKQILVGAVGFVLIFGVMYWLVMSGMSGSKVPPLGRVSGTVKLNGKPLAAASVLFQPIRDANDPNTKGKAGSIAGSVGITDKDGKYTLVYVQDTLGAVVGKHIVQIQGQNEEGVSVPTKYNHDTKLDAVVKAGSNPPINFDLTTN